jgi:hypothetical protein
VNQFQRFQESFRDAPPQADPDSLK